MTPRPAQAGFTLIELIIALALFALISLAGVALVESLLSIERRSEGRLERVAEVQRALFVIDNDISQITAGAVTGEGAALAFNRPVAAIGGVPVQLRYELVGDTVVRRFEGQGRQLAQPVLGRVDRLRWRFFTPADGWIDRWPPSEERAGSWPTAIAAEMTLASGAGFDGDLRRIVALPAKP